MVTEDDVLEMKARAMGDQAAAYMRDSMGDLKRIARSDPHTWTEWDAGLIRATLLGVLGMLYEGRI